MIGLETIVPGAIRAVAAIAIGQMRVGMTATVNNAWRLVRDDGSKHYAANERARIIAAVGMIMPWHPLDDHPALAPDDADFTLAANLYQIRRRCC